MKKLIYILILITSFTWHAFADEDGDVKGLKGKIKGTVVDEASKEPLEYATIALYNADNNKLVNGTITDFLGHFKIDLPKEGNYYLLITFIGLDEIKSEVFQVTGDQHNINLGNFFLQPASKDLGEVEVVGKRASIEYKIDKKVINVDKQITAAAGNAVDILESVPSVQVDVEGNVLLRGSAGFTVLIDGKPTILEPSDVLRQIPASSIENIEIITNPSVKYEPDGATGIINIITKKNYLDGLSGIVNLDAGMYGQYGGDFQLGYRINKFNFIVGANYNRRTRPGSVENRRYTVDSGDTSFINSSGEADRQYTSKSVRAGVEYNPTKKDFISISGRYGSWGMWNSSDLGYNTWTGTNTDKVKYNSFDKTTRDGDYYSIDGVYQHDFGNRADSNRVPKKNGQDFSQSVSHNLKLVVNYRSRDMEEISINTLRSLTTDSLKGKKSFETGPSTSLRLNLDYSLPLREKDKFEAGFQSRFNQSNEITGLFDLNPESGGYDPDTAFDNKTTYTRNIYALYALYAGMAGNFGYQAGLRGEYTDRVVQSFGQEEFIIDRWDFFPTLHLSYNLPLDQQLMTSYSRRIDRPRGWWLEPFITWQDAYNVRQGNPNLKPEYIDSYDLAYLIKFNENFFSLEGYYRVTHNKIERVTSVYTEEEEEEDVMLHSIENVGQDYSLGVEAMLNITLFPWWEVDLSGNFFRYKLEGVLYDDPFEQTSFNWNTRLNNTFNLWKNGQLQVNSRYNSASVTAQGTSSGYYTVDAAFKVSFLNRQLSVNLQGRDLFATARREHTSTGPDFYTFYKYQPKAPVLSLTISYRFNNFKTTRRMQDGDGNGDEF